MKKLFTLCCLGALSMASYAQNAESLNAAEVSPGVVVNEGHHQSNNNKALWDIQYDLNLSAVARGDVGMAGVAYIDGEFWTSRWSSDTLYRISSSGSLLEKFVIANLTGTRSITTDGTYLYAGTASTTIYRIDKNTKALAPPHITIPGSVGGARFLTYDATLDSGNGGFWTGNFNTDISAVDMSGNIIASIAAGTHGLGGMYGAAVDNVTPGGPYLWVFYQGGNNSTELQALNLPAGTLANNLDHDVFVDAQDLYGLSSGLAGGAFFTTDFESGTSSLVCLVQGTPDNVLIVYEIDEPLSISELEETTLNVYPVPANGLLNIDLSEVANENGALVLTDMSGREVLRNSINAGAVKHVMDVENTDAGVYLLTFTSETKSIQRKVIVQ